jgi:outer membrane protein assembly factor BamB
MNIHKRLRRWCQQPSERLPVKLKHYSMPATVTAVLIFSVSFAVFSLNTISPTTVPIMPVSDSPAALTAPILLWNYTTGGGVGSSDTFNGRVYTAPIVTQDALYVASDDGNVYALNLTSGAEFWKAGGEFPIVHNSRIFVGGYSEVYALNANDGTQIWTSSIAHGMTVSVGAPPVVADDVLYVGFDSFGIYALNAVTGDKLWHFYDDNTLHVASSPVVVDKVVYLGGSNTVFALNTQSGREIWKYTLGGSVSTVSAYPVASSFVVADGVIYFGAGDGNVYALNAANGEKIWNYTYALSGVYIPSPPIIDDGILYIGSNAGNVYALNITDGAKLWSSTIGNGSLSAPAVYSDVLYFGSSDDNIYALDAINGAELWNYKIQGYSKYLGLSFSGESVYGSHYGAGSPIVLNGVLYAGGGNNVYALKVSSADSSVPPPAKPTSNQTIDIAVIAALIIAIEVALIAVFTLKKKMVGVNKNGFA